MLVPSLSTGVSPRRGRFGQILALILIADALMVLPLLSRLTLWNSDEGRISEVAREMTMTGNWLVPRIGGEPFGSYPPLAYWLMALSATLFGATEFAMRLPGALAGISLIGILAVLVRRVAGDRAGLLAAIVLATTPGFLGQQSVCRADVLLALAATIVFERFLVVAGGDRRIRHLVILYVATALGILAKGPLAVVIPGLGVAVWFIIHRRWNVLLDLKPWYGALIVIALALPWYVAAYRVAGWEFIRLNLLLENVEAFAQGFEHPKPASYLFAITSYRIIPWALFLIFAWRVRRAPGLSLFLGWTAGVFLLLLASSSKRANYLTYGYPALAATIGVALSVLLDKAPHLVRRGIIGLALILGMSAMVALIVPVQWSGNFQALGDRLPTLCAIAAIVFIILFVVTLCRGAVAGTLTLACVLAGGFIVERIAAEPRIDRPGRRGVEFCRRVSAAMPAGQELATVGPDGPESFYYFYTGRTMPKRSGGAGYFIGTAEQRARFDSSKVQTLDSLINDSDEVRYFFKVSP